MIQSRRRRRYGSQGVSTELSHSMSIRVVGVVFVVALAAWGVSMLFSSFSPTSRGVRIATTLQTDGRGRVTVTLNGEGTAQRAESGLRLYDGDRIETDSVSNAVLYFFDGTVVSLDSTSAVSLNEVLQGEYSTVDINLGRGRLWMTAGTGTSVTRLINTPMGTHHIPAYTRVIVGGEQGVGPEQDDLYVFETSGPGIVSDFGLADLITGEGQELHVTAEQLRQKSEDLYALRSILDGTIFSSAFYLFNQQKLDMPIEEGVVAVQPATNVEGELLVVDSPQDKSIIEGNIVVVKGRVGSRVVTVRVNGYSANLLAGGVFEKELSLPAEEDFSVDIQAEDKDGLIIADTSLALHHDIQPPEAPTITFPLAAEEGVSISIQDNEFEIVGQASPETTGIIVNGYQLQKFKPGNPWKYLVDPAIGNVRIGENTYEIVAVDRAGNRSEPVTLSILWKAQPLTLVTTGEEDTGDRDTYIAPGSLRVIAPTDGSLYKTAENEVLIEGTTRDDTASISINGYNLSKYLSGKITWNYIAKTEFNNFYQGANRYTVVARNAEGKILDVLSYIIEKQ